VKRLLLGLGVGVLALLGAWAAWTLRRQPGGASLLEATGNGFTAQPRGQGRFLQFQDAQYPLRAFHWLPPMPGGFLAAQMLGQNDRQRVALFQDGTPTDTLLVLKPVGVADGFWRFAELRAAAKAPGGLIILLYQAGDPASTELPLVLAMDPATQQARWSYRGAGTRLALTDGPDTAVYLYGGPGPIQRLALGPAGGAGVAHPAAKVIELPPEVAPVEDLLPTGDGSFLASHRDGLSAYRAGSGWTHFPAPADRGQACQDWRSSLTRSGGGIWWQAVPGRMLKVGRDGHPGQEWQRTLPAGDPFALDARLWRVLGADAGGALWFSLAVPAPAPAPAAPSDPGAAQAPAPPPGTPAEGAQAPQDPAEAWGPYLAQGLDRIYRWTPAGNVLERVSLTQAWAALQPPPTVQAPAAGQGMAQGLVPAAGALLLEGPRCAWWLPLAALPFQPVERAQANQAR
jgi:hypothetical protein